VCQKKHVKVEAHRHLRLLEFSCCPDSVDALLQQVVGAICGSLLVNSLTPYDTIYVGMGDGGPGCFDQKSINHDISKSQIFGWEVG